MAILLLAIIQTILFNIIDANNQIGTCGSDEECSKYNTSQKVIRLCFSNKEYKNLEKGGWGAEDKKDEDGNNLSYNKPSCHERLETPREFECKKAFQRDDNCTCDSPRQPDNADCAQITKPQNPDFNKFCELLQLGRYWHVDPSHPASALRAEQLPGIGILRLDYEGDHSYGDTGATASYTSSYPCGVYVRYIVVPGWTFEDSQYGSFRNQKVMNAFIDAVKTLDNDPMIDIIACNVGYCMNYHGLVKKHVENQLSVILSSVVAGAILRPILGNYAGLVSATVPDVEERPRTKKPRFAIVTANEETFIPIIMNPDKYNQLTGEKNLYYDHAKNFREKYSSIANFRKVQLNNRKLLQLMENDDYRDAVVVVGMLHTCYGYYVGRGESFSRDDCWKDGHLTSIITKEGKEKPLDGKTTDEIIEEAKSRCWTDNTLPSHCTPKFTEYNGVRTALEVTLKLHPDIEYIVFESTQLGAFANNASETFEKPIVDATTAHRIALRAFRGGNGDTVWNKDSPNGKRNHGI